MVGASHEENRHFPRVKRNWFVHYARVGAPDADWGVGSVKDLSVTGASFRTEEILEMKTPLRMKFNLPIPALRMITGTVVRRHEVRPQQYEYGVIFEPLSPDEADVLQRYVTKLVEPD